MDDDDDGHFYSAWFHWLECSVRWRRLRIENGQKKSLRKTLKSFGAQWVQQRLERKSQLSHIINSVNEWCLLQLFRLLCFSLRSHSSSIHTHGLFIINSFTDVCVPMDSFVHSLTHSLTHTLINSGFFHPSINQYRHTFFRSFIHLYSQLSVHLFTYSFTAYLFLTLWSWKCIDDYQSNELLFNQTRCCQQSVYRSSFFGRM